MSRSNRKGDSLRSRVKVVKVYLVWGQWRKRAIKIFLEFVIDLITIP